ncbi:MAG: copper chaperone [Armatimonadetes bacterium]|nr:MAG: copper chaperone [Armatimonadota bacterium]
MTEQRILALKGMTCTGSEKRITAALSAVSGVEEASADHETRAVTLRVDPAVADDDAVRGAIDGLGYRVVA